VNESNSQTFAYYNITSDAKLTPEDIRMKTLYKEVSLLMRSPTRVGAIKIIRWGIAPKVYD